MRLENILLMSEGDDNDIVIIDEKKNWKRKEIKSRVNHFSMVLQQNGVKNGDKVVMISQNSSDFIVMLLAIMNQGAVAVPLDPQMPSASLERMIMEVRAGNVCVDKKSEGKFQVTDNNTYKLIQEEQINYEYFEFETSYKKSEEDFALLLYSSGTSSGKAKGILLTHHAIFHNMLAILDYMKPSRKDIFFITKTMVHASTLVGEVMAALYVNAKMIAYNTLVTPNTMLRKISQSNSTIVAVNPTIMTLLVNASNKNLDLSKVRLLYTSGAVIRKEILQKAEQLFTNAYVLNVYGLTEAGPRVCAQRAEDDSRKYGAVGRPINGVKIKIVDSEGKLAAPKNCGNIFVKSESMMTMYYQNEELTNYKLREGWLNTGDLGYIEDNGELVVLGRQDDMIIRNANNIDPIVVENVIKKLKGVLDCIVFGVSDDFYGNKVVAAITCKDGVCYKLQDIISYSSTFLLPHECPQELCIWKEIPKTTNGKVSRRLASNYYMESNRK